MKKLFSICHSFYLGAFLVIGLSASEKLSALATPAAVCPGASEALASAIQIEGAGNTATSGAGFNTGAAASDSVDGISCRQLDQMQRASDNNAAGGSNYGQCATQAQLAAQLAMSPANAGNPQCQAVAQQAQAVGQRCSGNAQNAVTGGLNMEKNMAPLAARCEEEKQKDEGKEEEGPAPAAAPVTPEEEEEEEEKEDEDDKDPVAQCFDEKVHPTPEAQADCLCQLEEYKITNKCMASEELKKLEEEEEKEKDDSEDSAALEDDEKGDSIVMKPKTPEQIREELKRDNAAILSDE